MPSYTDTFGGETINPALLSFITYEITATTNLSLVWPMDAAPDATVAADKIDVSATVASLGITLPPANQTSVGQDVLIRNTGANTFFVYDQDGIEIGEIASGEAWYFVLIDNSDAAGTWYAIEFGAGTSTATASSLAGSGLRALMARLDQNLLTTPLNGNYSVTSGDRATVVQNNGGAVVWTFAAVATLGNGWFVYCINAGTGSLVLTPSGGATIDGNATKTMAPTESAIVFCDGTNLHSLGYGRSVVTTVTGNSINAAGTGTLTLSASEIQAQIQDFSGTLTGNRIIDYGGGVGYWFVYNNTVGAYTLTMRVNNLDAGVAITQGSFSIIRSNGTNMRVAFTATTGTVTSVATGTGLTGGPITTTGTVTLANTAVAPGSYGTAAASATLAVDQQGRITSAVDTPIAITISQVAAFTSAALLGRLTDETGTGLAVFNNTPTLTGPVLTGPVFSTITNGAATLTLPTTSDTLVGRATTDTLTNKILDTAGAGNVLRIASQQITAVTGASGTVLTGGTAITNSLVSNAPIVIAGTYVTGPTVAQGAIGTWFVSGTVTFGGATFEANWLAKLWDGTTVIASGQTGLVPGGVGTISLSGYLTNPAGNLRISVTQTVSNDGVILYNNSGNSKDSTISAFRIA